VRTPYVIDCHVLEDRVDPFKNGIFWTLSIFDGGEIEMAVLDSDKVFSRF